MDKLKSLSNKVTKNKFVESIKGNSMVMDALKMVGILLVILVIMLVFSKYVSHLLNTKHDSPIIIEASKNAKNSLVVTQDPKNENSITLYRSNGDLGEMQFTYSFWFAIENMEYKFGEWKHIFHKGNKTSYPNRAPGVFIHPDKNAIRIYMNTFDNILEYVDIENIPIKRWVHMAIVLNGKYFDIYVNGYLRKRHEFKSMVKQNFGDLWVNLYGGFEGYICRLRYYRYALKYNQIEDIVRKGPSSEDCSDSGDKPPYLNDNWWYDI